MAPHQTPVSVYLRMPVSSSPSAASTTIHNDYSQPQDFQLYLFSMRDFREGHDSNSAVVRATSLQDAFDQILDSHPRMFRHRRVPRNVADWEDGDEDGIWHWVHLPRNRGRICYTITVINQNERVYWDH